MQFKSRTNNCKKNEKLFAFVLFEMNFSKQKDDYDQLVTVSSVDGDTFIVDQHGNLTCFRPPLSSNTGCAGDNDSIGTTNFFDQIQAFTCGLFGDNNMFCFIYVLTHNDKIMIVHSIEITNTNTKNLLAVLDEKYEDGN